MSSLNSFIGNITGTTGSVNTLEPKSGWKAYLFPRGAHASAASAASPITFDSSQAASRFSANDWFQVGTDTSKIRQISAVAANSFTYSGSAVSVALNDRILRIGSTQPVVTGSNAEYQPNTTTYPRDDDGGTPSGSSTTTDSNGLYQFFASDALYDILIQDSNGANTGMVVDAQIGNQIVNDLTPTTSGGASLGTCTLPFANLRFVGMIDSGITSASGRTAFKFDTCNAITAGNLFSFGNTGSVKVYGDTHGGIFHSYTLPEVYNVKSARFGAKGDGSTDDTTAIQNALAAADADSDGGVVFLPPGTYIVTSTLTIPNTQVRLVGSGNRSSIIKAGAGFSFNGTTDAVIKLGAGGDGYGRIEDLQIDCNSVANSIGLHSTNINEGGGAFRVLILNHMVKGIFFSGNGCQHFNLTGVDVGYSTASTTAIGMDFLNCSNFNTVRDCTVNCNGSGTNTSYAIGVSGGANWLFERIHTERYDVSMELGTNASGHVRGLGSQTSTVRVGARINNLGWSLDSVSGGSIVVENLISGHSVLVNEMLPGGWYLYSNEGASGNTRSFLTSTNVVPNRLFAPMTFGATLTVTGQFGVTNNAQFGGSIVEDMDSVTLSSDTLSATGRRSIILSNGAGQNTVTTISGGITGQLLELVSTGGTWSVTDGNSIFTAGAFTATAADTIEFRCINGVSWFERHRSVN